MADNNYAQYYTFSEHKKTYLLMDLITRKYMLHPCISVISCDIISSYANQELPCMDLS
jgi:hypothetical protein